ncbi:MAG: protein kinase [Myxococcota bacterium]
MTPSSQDGDPLGVAYEVGDAVITYGTIWVRRGRRRSDGRAVLIQSPRGQARRLEWARSILERQARVLAAVDHPRLPSPLEVSRAADHFALVFPDHGGHRLGAVLNETRHLSAHAILVLGAQLAGALAALHRAGEVHGALRPELVEITDRGQLYLHGAGMRPRGAERGRDELLEVPAFMAPEMILGDEPTDAADVFLLGLLLHFCATGAHPFAGDDDDDNDGVSQRIRHEEAPALPTRKQDGAMVELSRIVRRCLAKRPDDRYLDMADAQRALVRVLRKHTAEPEEAILAQALAGMGLADELPTPRRRHLLGDQDGSSRWLPWLAAAGLVGGLALFVVGLDRCGEPDPDLGREHQRLVARPAAVRLLAHPWAEVFIDGKRIDVTPIGRPVPLAPGRHVVAFRHPQAPEVTRTVEVRAGQTVLLDVQMQIAEPVPSATAITEEATSP